MQRGGPYLTQSQFQLCRAVKTRCLLLLSPISVEASSLELTHSLSRGTGWCLGGWLQPEMLEGRTSLLWHVSVLRAVSLTQAGFG